MTSDIRSDEQVVFYPTVAFQQAGSDRWTVPIHGIIFESEDSSLKRRALISLLRRSIDIDKDEEISEILRSRISRFLVDNERGKRVVVRLGGRDIPLAKSGSNGHFYGAADLSPTDAVKLLKEHGKTDGWVPYAAVVREGDDRSFDGRVQFIPREGLSVISDIDDTVKISNVTNKKELLRNTFLRPAKAVPGMANRYQAWSKEGVAIHYLSASPWQLFEMLDSFRSDAGLPQGSFLLRNFRLKDSSALDFLSSSAPYKTAAIESLLTAFPKRTFVLVGDSGENDPEIYGEIYRKNPKLVSQIIIRNVTRAKRDDERFRKAMSAVPDSAWQLIDEATEIRDLAEPGK